MRKITTFALMALLCLSGATEVKTYIVDRPVDLIKVFYKSLETNDSEGLIDIFDGEEYFKFTIPDQYKTTKSDLTNTWNYLKAYRKCFEVLDQNLGKHSELIFSKNHVHIMSVYDFLNGEKGVEEKSNSVLSGIMISALVKRYKGDNPGVNKNIFFPVIKNTDNESPIKFLIDLSCITINGVFFEVPSTPFSRIKRDESLWSLLEIDTLTNYKVQVKDRSTLKTLPDKE